MRGFWWRRDKRTDREEGIHWPDLDEDISMVGRLAGPGDHSKVR